MPGVFPDSPSSKPLQRNSSQHSSQERGGLFSSFTKHFKDGNRSSWNPFSDTTPSPNLSNRGPLPPPPEQPKTPQPVTTSSSLEMQQKLLAAVQSSRPHGSTGLFSPPQTSQINDLKSYCDEKPSHDLEFAATLPCRINILFAKTVPDRSAFLAAHSAGVNTFGNILLDCAAVFSLRPESLSMFYDPFSKAIGFNRAGSIFCNYHFFQQLHEKEILQNAAQHRPDAMVYWWVTLCHELAHNLVQDHSSAHSYYTYDPSRCFWTLSMLILGCRESFVSYYFHKLTAKITMTAGQ